SRTSRRIGVPARTGGGRPARSARVRRRRARSPSLGVRWTAPGASANGSLATGSPISTTTGGRHPSGAASATLLQERRYGQQQKRARVATRLSPTVGERPYGSDRAGRRSCGAPAGGLA